MNNAVHYEDALMVKAAWYYYFENMTQQAIADRLSISRMRVIKLLETARQNGVIQFRLRSDSVGMMQQSRELMQKYHLKDVFIIPEADQEGQLNESIARAGAMYVADRLSENACINVGYGDTLSRTLNHLATMVQNPVTCISLTGGVSYYLPNGRSNIFNARLYLMPAPLLASSHEMAAAMRAEASVSEIIRMAALSSFTLDNYKYLFSGNEDSRKYFMWYKNSLILTLITVVLTLLVCYFIAYGLTMYKFKLQGFLFFLVIATMCVPFEILMLPLYNEVTSLGIINTRAGVILPGLCGASTIFFFKQYMQSLPKELLDAGRIDGCTEYGISVKIMMPITKPAFASMAILCAMGSWNNMLWPMLVFRDTSKFTLQIGLNTLLTPYGNNYNLLIAGSMFGILPILIIYLIFQRYFVEGMAGAVKS